MTQPDQPNFLFLITDQHRADWLGCMGHPVVQTPNIDAIAGQGTMFQNFHVASPVCMPNRASLMTGRMPSMHGLRYNGCTLPQTATTFVDVLRAAGYDTASIGKSHLSPFTTMAPMSGQDGKTRLIDEAWATDTADYGQEQPDRYADTAPYAFDTPYYGFDHVDMVTAHGDRCGGHYGQWFRQNCPDWQAMRDNANQIAHNYTCPQAYRTPIPEAFYPTAYIGQQASDWIAQRKGNETPFFAFVSFPDPHHPFNPPGKYWDMYSPDQFEVDLPFDAHHNPTPPMAWMHDNWKGSGGQLTAQTAMCTSDQQLREAMALTAGMITMVDDQIGQIIAALKDSGQYDNTVIIFTSDHGDYLGDFNMLLKGAMPFRSITRVPCLWSEPGDRTARSTTAMASTIDLSASILDRAGLEPYWGMTGQSFLPALDGTQAHRDAVYTEYNDGAARLGFDAPARVRSLLTEDWRFTLYGGLDWGELYDLRNDPRETRNLWEDPDYAGPRAEMSLRLNHHLTAEMDESPRANRLA